MSNIDKLVVENFKAFYGTNTIDLEGKHLLIYGENGSGKSSIYWALYTLLQSTTKTEEDIAKYFDRASEENLLNIFSIVDDAFVKISTSDEPDTFHKISRTGYELEGATARPYSYLGALNASSDFISHRLLINFYNFRNSKEINLWEVFVRDIFPFITTVNEGATVTLSQLYKDILETLPFYNFVAAGGRNTFKVRQSNHNQRQNCIRKINLLNEAVNNELANINGLVNAFYTNNFKDDDDDNIEISLEYSLRLSFGDIFQTERRGLINYIFPSKKHIKLNSPFIKLKIRKQKEDLTWIDIARPQSYFNEALLTQIALSVRFALTQQRMGSFEGQFLALDDLLVSLDMSNRNKVVDIILNVFAPHYKIYLFTHERSFYNMVKRKIETQYVKSDWTFKEMYQDKNTEFPNPYIKPDRDSILIAEDFLNIHDYPACGIYLRKEVEKILTELLPENLRKELKTEDGVSRYVDVKLNDLVNNFKPFCERENIDYTPFKDLKTYKDLLLNPLAHNDNEASLFKTELTKLISIVKLLNKIKRGRVFLKHRKNINFVLNKPDGTYFSVRMKSQENIVLLEEDGIIPRLSHFNKCKVIGYDNNGTINSDEEMFDTIQDAYIDMCTKFNFIPVPGDLSTVFSYEGQTFEAQLAIIQQP